LKGNSTRPGVLKCYECQKPFSVTVGTVFERSHIPLHKWVYATHLLTTGKKGTSSHQIHRMLGITYKSAWFMTHRIREAMREAGLEPLGGAGKIVEADETYFGRTAKPMPLKKKRYSPYTKKGWKGKGKTRPIIALVERGGNVRTFHVAHADKDTVGGIVAANIDRESRLHTDESPIYPEAGKQFAAHETVKHSRKEYVRGDVHTNSAEGYFSIFKRGMRGVYQHCSEKHLHRYLAEYDFRYNHRAKLGVEDAQRASLALQGASGKRLTYRRIDQA
jgi:hypothetical protein